MHFFRINLHILRFCCIFAPNLTKKSRDSIPRTTEQHNEKF